MTLPTLMGAVFLASATAAEECDALFQMVGWGGGDVPLRELTSEDFANGTVILTRADVAKADPGFDQVSQPVVMIRFTAKGTKAFAQYTIDNVGGPVAVIYDGTVITAPIIREPILGGQAQISGNFTQQDTEEMARNLTSKTCPPQAEP